MLSDVVREKLRAGHYSHRTEEAYLGWIRQFILANGRRHPRELGGAEVEAFLSGLATERTRGPATRHRTPRRRWRSSTASSRDRSRR